MRSAPFAILGFALVVIFCPPQPAAAAAQQRVAGPAAAQMTNGDVIQMVRAGLSDQVVMGAIRGATARNFDLTAKGLVDLAKAGVSEAVILAMQDDAAAASSAKAPPPIAAATPGATARSDSGRTPLSATAVPAAVLAEDGLYYIDGGTVKRVEAKTPYQTRSGSTMVSRLTFGIKRNRLNAMLSGLSADVQVTQSPRFYLHLEESESVGEYYLIRFTVKQQQGRRELEVGSAGLGKVQAGFEEKDIFLIEATRLQKV
ncbi:MAG: hypothetical protein Q7R45_03530, partial [Sulfuricaulis sp.]|nr:hypothetical protein [Sulfuricaulis sp.]